MLKRPGRILHIIFIALNSFIWAVLTLCAAPLLLIAAGVLALVKRKNSARPPQNEADSASEQTPPL